LTFFFGFRILYKSIQQTGDEMNNKSKLSLVLLTSIILILSDILILSGCSAGKIDQKPKKTSDALIGVKIYHVDEGKPKQNLFEEWNSLGINTAFVSEELLADAEFRELAQANSIKLFVILPIFYAPEKLEKEPELYAVSKDGRRAENDWVKFVCPSREEYNRERKENLSGILIQTASAWILSVFLFSGKKSIRMIRLNRFRIHALMIPA